MATTEVVIQRNKCYLVNYHTIFTLAALATVSCLRISAVDKLGTNKYFLITIQAARDAACTTWCFIFILFMLFLGHSDQSMKDAKDRLKKYTDDNKNHVFEYDSDGNDGHGGEGEAKKPIKAKRMYPYFMLKTRYRLLVIGFFLVSFPFTLIGNPLSVALYYEGNAKTAGGEKANLTGPRALFLGCAAVYIYCIVSGIGMFLLAWRTKTFGNPQQTTA